jgi:malate dehydrogenase
MAVHSDGSYGVDEGLMSSFPVRLSGGGTYSIEQGLEVGDFARSKIDTTVGELKDEREAVKGLGLV